MIEIVENPIDVATLTGGPFAGIEGGIVTFVGTVRGKTHGRDVVRLEYEAFPEMAISEIETIVGEAKRRFAVDRVDVVHRVGILFPGDVAVVIVVRAAHRGAAFDACRFTIDTLKETVPIWKKEVFRDGEEWVADRP